MLICFFVFKQKTAYEMRISDWSSDVCSSDLVAASDRRERLFQTGAGPVRPGKALVGVDAIGRDAEFDQRVLLGGKVLFVGGASGVADQRVCHGEICNVKGSLNAKDIVPSICESAFGGFPCLERSVGDRLLNHPPSDGADHHGSCCQNGNGQ